jgi:hypothetical protein
MARHARGWSAPRSWRRVRLDRMLIKRDGEEWHEPEVSAYRNEKALQKVLIDASHLLPKSSGPAIVVDELPVSSGSLDLVAVEPSGQLVLCECKLEANAQSRRTVVGQLLSYAGAVWQLDYDDFVDRFSRRLGRPLIDAVRAVADDAWDEDEFREALTEGLSTGAFRLIVAVDAITEELKSTVRYLSQHSTPGVEVLALELGYTRDGDVEILVSNSYGAEVTRPKPRRPEWNEEGLFETLKQGCTHEGVAAVRELWGFLVERKARPSWGRGHGAGVTLYLTIDGEEQPLFSIYGYTETQSTVAVNFEWLASRGVRRGRLDQVAAQVRSIPGADERLAGLEAADFRKRPGLAIDTVLAAPGAVDRLKALVDTLESPV